MLCSAPLSAWSDRVGRLTLLIGGYVAYALFYLALSQLTATGPPILLLFAAYGLFMASTEGVQKALIADLAPRAREGTAFGWFHLTTGCMLLPASLLFGQIYQSISPAAAFGFSACCAGLAALLLATWVGRAVGRPPTCV
jgi:MFS family permease